MDPVEFDQYRKNDFRNKLSRYTLQFGAKDSAFNVFFVLAVIATIVAVILWIIVGAGYDLGGADSGYIAIAWLLAVVSSFVGSLIYESVFKKILNDRDTKRKVFVG